MCARPKVFVADDDPILLRGLRLALRRRGYAVETAPTGRGLLALVRGEHPDLVIVDLMMPGMSGLDVLREVRCAENGPAVPVMLITASSDPGVSAKARRAGAVDVVEKPFRLDAFVERLEACLASSDGVAAPAPDSSAGPAD